MKDPEQVIVSCDSMVALGSATHNGQTIFAKNSDRPKEECQPLVQRARQDHKPSSMVKCGYMEIPQAATTYAHIGSGQYWCWGYEHGINEFQVAIGNEGLNSRAPESPTPVLMGMELVRLGLERSRTAAEAVEVITGLISEHGQGKFKGNKDPGNYDNGFMVADPNEAYAIETAGHDWVVQKAVDTLSISNVHTLGKECYKLSPTAEKKAIKKGWWKPEQGPLIFAKVFSGCPKRVGRPWHRKARTSTVLQQHRGSIDSRLLFSLLRDHSDGEDPAEPWVTRLPVLRSVCMHYTDDLPHCTAASLVADLCADNSRLPVSWCSMYAACLGIFIPVFIQGQLPHEMTVGEKEPEPESLWWQFRGLEKKVRLARSGKVVKPIRAQWKSLEKEFMETAYPMAATAKKVMDQGETEQARTMLTEYMADNTKKVTGVLKTLSKKL